MRGAIGTGIGTGIDPSLLATLIVSCYLTQASNCITSHHMVWDICDSVSAATLVA
jgi:hypothetical protein